MKKQLLFAAMLTLTAAPAAAQIFDINQTETVSSDLDLAMYELNSLIETSITKIQATYDIIKQKDPENSVLSALDYNLQLIKEIETEAQSKYEAGTLTVEEIANYKTQVEEYAKVEEDAIEKAEIETYMVLVSQKYMSVSSDLNEALGNVSLEVQNYYVDAFYALEADLATAYNKSNQEDITTKELSDIYDEIIAISSKVEALSDAAEAASSLVEKINANLEVLDSTIVKVKADFPEYDLSYTIEAKTYWQEFVDEFAAAPKDEENIYTVEDIEIYEQNFGYFQEEASNLYANAQMDEFMAQFNEKYYPLNNAIYDYQMNLFDECTHLTEDSLAVYYNALDDLSVELSNMYYVLYGDPISQAEFDKMLARVEEIEKEAKAIYDKAIEAENEAVATGINGVSADKVSADKAYTLDGKAVKSLAGKKGIFVVNGKKVILK